MGVDEADKAEAGSKVESIVHREEPFATAETTQSAVERRNEVIRIFDTAIDSSWAQKRRMVPS